MTEIGNAVTAVRPKGRLCDVEYACPVCGRMFVMRMTSRARQVERETLAAVNGVLSRTCRDHTLADVHAMLHGRRR